MTNKKNELNYKFGAFGYSFVAAVMLGGVIYGTCTNDRCQDYVITDKGANKIVYHSIANPSVNHVMTFDGDTIDPRGGFYPYLNIGDTIRGNTRFMNEPVNKSWYYRGMRLATSVAAIQTVNGRTLKELREIACRDSLIRKIKQR